MFSRGVIGLISDPNAALAYWRQIATISLSPGRDGSGTSLGLPRCSIDQIVPSPGAIPVTLIEYQHVYGDVLLQELIAICKIARFKRPSIVFEIGTYLGGTTLQLAANSSAEVYTLDLPPPGHMDHVEPQIVDPELDVYPDQPGVRFKGSPYANRIHQLLGDSRTLDFTPYYNSVDLVFVDGSHHYDCVLSDSRHALKMMSRGGAVIWHDYASYAPGVVQVLNDLGKVLPLVHLAETSLVVHQG